MCDHRFPSHPLLAIAIFVSLSLVARHNLGQAMVTRTELFDSDPGWDGHNNRAQTPPPRTITQDFGYSAATINAGGPAGEIGGLITPAGEPAYYGKVIPTVSLNDPLSASGTLNVAEVSHTLLGFFNSETLNEWRTPNTISIRLLSRRDFFFAYGDYATSLWRAGGNAFTQVGGNEFEFDTGPGAVHNWSLEYDPTGNGLLTATIGDQTVVTPLEPGHKADGATFDRFGLMTVMKSADTPGEVWLDNLTVIGVTESFDSDPHWDSVNNRNTYVSTNVRPRFDFGYSPTNLAGGQAAGEMGGATFRGDSRTQFDGSRMAFYGDELDNTLSLDQPLMAAGKVALHRGVSDSTTLIGFFHSSDSVVDSDSQDSAIPENFLGAAIEGPSAEGFYFYPTYGVDQEGVRPGGNRGSPTPPFLYPSGHSRDWTLQYDPLANGNRGRITVTLDGQVVRLNLDAGHKQIGAHFDRFGIITTHIDGNGQTVYFDDLMYTVGTSVEPPQIEWAADASADATAAFNWNPQVPPNGSDVTVLLGSAITQSRVLFADTEITMKSLLIDNINAYVLAGQGSLHLQADTGNSSLTVLQGSHELRIPVNLGSDLDVTVLAGATLTLDNLLDLNGFTLTKFGSGDLVINNLLTLDGGSIRGTVANNALIPEPPTTSLLMMMAWLVQVVRGKPRSAVWEPKG